MSVVSHGTLWNLELQCLSYISQNISLLPLKKKTVYMSLSRTKQTPFRSEELKITAEKDDQSYTEVCLWWSDIRSSRLWYCHRGRCPLSWLSQISNGTSKDQTSWGGGLVISQQSTSQNYFRPFLKQGLCKDGHWSFHQIHKLYAWTCVSSAN